MPMIPLPLIPLVPMYGIVEEIIIPLLLGSERVGTKGTKGTNELRLGGGGGGMRISVCSNVCSIDGSLYDLCIWTWRCTSPWAIRVFQNSDLDSNMMAMSAGWCCLSHPWYPAVSGFASASTAKYDLWNRSGTRLFSNSHAWEKKMSSFIGNVSCIISSVTLAMSGWNVYFFCMTRR